MSCWFLAGFGLSFGNYRFVLRIVHLLTILLVVVVFYCEWWDHRQHHQQWPTIDLLHSPDSSADPSSSSSSSSSLVLLLVADAGIDSGGDYSGGNVAQWDLQRYIRRNFLAALDHVRPDVVVFVGSTIAPTLKSVDVGYQQVYRYMQLFSDVFPLPDDVRAIGVGEVWLPSNLSEITVSSLARVRETAKRFSLVFSRPLPYCVKFTCFFESSNVTDRASVTPVHHLTGDRRHFTGVLLSRSPVTCNPPYTATLTHTVADMLVSLGVSVVFSAHQHRSYISIQNKLTNAIYRRQSLSDSTLQHINLHDDNVVELVVPTCNYQHGKHRVGFGVAKIDAEGSLHYSVLWLPPRRRHLALYLASFLCTITLAIGCYLLRRQKEHTRPIYQHLAAD